MCRRCIPIESAEGAPEMKRAIPAAGAVPTSDLRSRVRDDELRGVAHSTGECMVTIRVDPYRVAHHAIVDFDIKPVVARLGSPTLDPISIHHRCRTCAQNTATRQHLERCDQYCGIAVECDQVQGCSGTPVVRPKAQLLSICQKIIRLEIKGRSNIRLCLAFTAETAQELGP